MKIVWVFNELQDKFYSVALEWLSDTIQGHSERRASKIKNKDNGAPNWDTKI